MDIGDEDMALIMQFGNDHLSLDEANQLLWGVQSMLWLAALAERLDDYSEDQVSDDTFRMLAEKSRSEAADVPVLRLVYSSPLLIILLIGAVGGASFRVSSRALAWFRELQETRTHYRGEELKRAQIAYLMSQIPQLSEEHRGQIQEVANASLPAAEALEEGTVISAVQPVD